MVAGYDELEGAASFQQTMEIAEQEIDVEVAFVCFIDDNTAIPVETWVLPGLREQHPVGHEFDPGILRRPIMKANFTAHQVTVTAEFFLDPPGDRRGGNAAGLCAADQTGMVGGQVEADFR